MSKNIFCNDEILPKHNHCSAIVVVKVNPFGNLPSRNGQQNSASSVVTRLAQDKRLCEEYGK